MSLGVQLHAYCRRNEGRGGRVLAGELTEPLDQPPAVFFVNAGSVLSFLNRLIGSDTG
jgi:hypothetical protein